MGQDRIISVGLLTERDLALLGESFSRHFPVPRDHKFDRLLALLDEVELEDLEEPA